MRQLPGHLKYHLKYQGVLSLTSTAGRVGRDRWIFIVSRCFFTDCYSQVFVICKPTVPDYKIKTNLNLLHCYPCILRAALSLTQPEPGGGATHSTCISAFSSSLLSITVFTQAALNLTQTHTQIY